MEMKKKLVIAGIVAVAALFILSLSDRNFLYPALVGAMVLMHLGMYGMHGKHGDENMVKCDGCGDFVKRSKATATTVDDKQRFFCCKGCAELFRQRCETLIGVKQ